MQIDSIMPALSPMPTVGSQPLQEGSAVASGDGGVQKTFGQFLQDAIGEVNQAQMHAVDMSNRFAAGEPLDVHQVMVASQEASVALNLALQVRNKLVDSYQEIMRVNI